MTDTPEAIATIATRSQPASPAMVDDGHETGTVFDVLAIQARDRNSGGLWMTTIGGAANTVLLWSQHSSLRWIASGFAAVAAYGTWALADRALSSLRGRGERGGISYRAATVVRVIAVAAGVIAAVGAAAGFMAAALGGWQH